MLNNQDTSNSFDFSKLPHSWDDLKNAHLYSISACLRADLVNKNASDPLPQHANLPEMLSNILQRLNDLTTPALQDNCAQFVGKPEDANCYYGKGQVGEHYLKVRGICLFYLGSYEEAAKYLAALGVTYHRNHRAETDAKCVHFNELAALAYLRANNVKMARFHRMLKLSRGDWFNINRRNVPEVASLEDMDLSSAEGKEIFELFDKEMHELFSHTEIVLPVLSHHVNTVDGYLAQLEEITINLKQKFKLKCDTSDPVQRMELDYDFWALWVPVYINHMKLAGRDLLSAMSLQDLHRFIKASVYPPHNSYNKILDLFRAHAYAVTPKIETIEDMIGLYDYRIYNGNSVAHQLVRTTSDDERRRLVTLLSTNMSEISEKDICLAEYVKNEAGSNQSSASASGNVSEIGMYGQTGSSGTAKVAAPIHSPCFR